MIKHTSWRLRYNRDLGIIVTTILFPFLFYIYMIVPENVSYFESNWFKLIARNIGWDLHETSWIISYNFLTIALLSLWYITCNNKWRYIILIPVVIEFLKCSAIIFDLIEFNNNYRIIKTLVISYFYILFITYISIKLGYYSVSNQINQEIDIEIEKHSLHNSGISKTQHKLIKDNLIELRMKESTMSSIQYLKELIKLRDKINQ